jgi:23S rRNA pseudouridine1911/1915/1917 synthase
LIDDNTTPPDDDEELDEVAPPPAHLAPAYDFVVDQAGDGERLDIWLAARGLPISRSQIRRRIEEGEVTVGGQRARPARKLRRGEKVRFVPPPPAPVEDLPEDIPLSILYEDERLIVVDKPAGMVVHPATSHQSGTLVNALLHHCGASLKGVGGERRPGIVHRLDRDTSGVMVVAKDEPTLVGLQQLFLAGKVDGRLERRYLALVEGVVAERGTFRTKYGRDPRDRKKFSSRVPSGRHAVTHWVVRERLPGATLVEAQLETGRTHQIRVHFKDAGHPLVGDVQYGRPPRDPRLREIARALGRQALHAYVLGLVHPATGAFMRWQTEPPADFRAALEALRGANSR